MRPIRALVRKSPIYLGVVSQLMQFGFGLLILPVALSRLSPATIGLWYVFVAAQSLVGLLDFGFTQTFSRNFAYVFAGARTLLKEGIEAKAESGMDEGLFAELLRTSKRIYRIVALVTGGVLLSLGTWYVARVSRSAGLAAVEVWSTWFLFVAALTLNVYFQWQSALLIGADRVQQNYRIQIASRATQLALSVGGLLVRPGLGVLVVGYACSVIVTRIYGLASIRGELHRASQARSIDRRPDLFPVLWHNASRLGLASVGAFLITRFSTFAVGYFLGLAVAGQYGIAMQALGVIQALSQVAFSLNMPKISAARVEADRPRLRHLVLRSLGFAWAFFVVASAALIVAGPTLLRVIHSRTHLPAAGVLVLMSVVWLLESNHTNCATVIVTGNTVPFVPAALASGVAVAAGITAAGWLGGGLASFVLIQGVVQAAYNNWKWPLLVYRELADHPSPVPLEGGLASG